MAEKSMPKTVTRQSHGYDLNPGPSAPESSMLTTQLLSHPVKAAHTHTHIITVHNLNAMLTGHSGLVVEHPTAARENQVQISMQVLVFIMTATAIYSLGDGLCIFTALPISIAPSTLCGTTIRASAFRLSNTNIW